MKKHIITFAAGLLAITAVGQDFQSSQPFTTPLQLNPALMGPNQDIRANIGYRTQWADVKDFTTMHATVMMPLWDRPGGQLDGGIAFNNDVAGGFTTNDIKAALGYDLQLETAHHLSVALSGGYGMRSFDFASQTWDSQYSAGEFDPAATNGEVAGDEKASWVNAGFGLLYYYTPPRDSISAFAGVSGNEVYSPKESYLQNSNGELLPRYTAIGGVKLMTKENIDVTPHIIASRQGGSQDISAGLYIDYKLPLGWSGKTAAKPVDPKAPQVVNITTGDTTATTQKPKKPFFEKQDPKITIGSWYHQHSNAVSFLVGVRFDKFALGYTYDFSPRYLRNEAFGNSTHEITLSFMMPWSDKPVPQVFSIW